MENMAVEHRNKILVTGALIGIDPVKVSHRSVITCDIEMGFETN